MRRSLPLTVLALAALLTAGIACDRRTAGGPPAPGRRPHLVVLLVDTLRADHLGAYGYARATSPNIDALAAQGIRFSRAFSSSSWTRPAVGSLFTSLLPSEHGAVGTTQPLAEGFPTLAELLHAAGYRTIGVSANFAHVQPATGFARGFDDFVAPTVEVGANDPFYLFERRDAQGVSHRVRDARGAELNEVVLSRLPERLDQPVFLYVHYMDPHFPYAPPAPFARRFVPPNATLIDPMDLYDGEVASVDAAIGQLRTALSARGFGADTVTVVVADHGEEFGDHGGWYHGKTLYREVLQVPLVIHDGRRAGAGEVRDVPVDLLDLPTTLLALAGVPAAPGMRGRDLLSDPAELPQRDLVAELHGEEQMERVYGPRWHVLALTRWPWTWLAHRDETRELYQLERDPEEWRPLAAADAPPGLAAAAAQAALAATRPTAGTPGHAIDAETRDALRALGYAR